MKPLEAKSQLNERYANVLQAILLAFGIACAVLLFAFAVTPRLQAELFSLEQVPREGLGQKFATELEEFKAEPLQLERLIALSTLALKLGDETQARRFAELAADRNARNFSAQVKLIDMLVAEGDFARALHRVDGVLRAQPAESPLIFGVLLALAQQKNAISEVVKALAMEPPWRRNFFNFASRDIKNVDALYGLFSALRKKNLPVAESEIRAFLKTLVEQEEIERAYFIWLDLLNGKQLRNVKLLYDGGFSDRIQNLYFDWTVREAENVDVSLRERQSNTGDWSLMLDFMLAKPKASLVEQIVVLPPGDYVFSGEARAQNFSNVQNLQWEVRCGENTKAMAKLMNYGFGTEWTTKSADINIPAQGCTYQRIVLRNSDVGAQQAPISGQVYFDNLRIARKSVLQ